MKTVDISNIVEGSRRLGATGITLLHLAEAIKETTANVIKGIGVDPSGVVALYGCFNSGIGSNFIISAGAVYYNGEVYDVDAFTGTASGGQTAVISIVTTYRTEDPVLYSNGQKYPTHAIRKMQWSISTIGSGVADYLGLVRIKDRVNSNLLDVPGQISASAASVLASANAYADSLVVGLWDDRGNYNPSSGNYPSSGGSGVAGAIKKGDIWTISANGTLPTGKVVESGDTVRALIDSPGNTQANWAIAQNNIGYVPLNKSGDSMSGDLDMASNKITNLQAASNPGDAVRFDQLVNIPAGLIVMWSGIVAPSGWALCDGGGGRPDLRGRFIVGYNSGDTDYDLIGETGGSKQIA
jgi:hypothetical protein